MRQSPSGRSDTLLECGAAQTKARHPNVAMTAKAEMVIAASERCMEPPCSQENEPAQGLERRGGGFFVVHKKGSKRTGDAVAAGGGTVGGKEKRRAPGYNRGGPTVSRRVGGVFFWGSSSF